ncbi:MAG: translation initiation factor IF-2 subunit alpha [Nanoarchaeota archaeon]
MLLQKKGFPEESELVLCTVTNVQGHSVFVKIEDYGVSGMIHISEVAPGRIRNIRDFVKEGKTIVCKVLRINKDRGHIDLSLRRVTESQRRSKIADIKQQQKATKIVEHAAKKLKIEPDIAYKEVSEKLLTEYDSVFIGFMDIVENNISLEKLGVNKALAEEVEKVVKQRLKPETVEVRGTLSLSSTASDGVEKVKAALKEAKSEPINMKYLGAGRFLLGTTASDYKSAEETLRKASDKAIAAIKKVGGIGDYKRKGE